MDCYAWLARCCFFGVNVHRPRETNFAQVLGLKMLDQIRIIAPGDSA
jgi:hypothetical protein